MGSLFLKLRELYQQGRRGLPRSGPQPDLELQQLRLRRHPDEAGQGIQRQGHRGRHRSQGPDQGAGQGRRPARHFGQLRDDGSTSCGNWLFAGRGREAGNLMARRDNADPSGLGFYPAGAFPGRPTGASSTTAPTADPSGKPWDPKRKTIAWDGSKWSGYDVPDIKAGRGAGRGRRALHHAPRRCGPPLRPGQDGGGAFPRALRALRNPARGNPMHPNNPLATQNPAARVFKGDLEIWARWTSSPTSPPPTGSPSTHYWTKTRAVQRHHPAGAVRRDRTRNWRRSKGIRNGDVVKVTSNRG
jgi:hypothetical protein